MEQVDKLAHHLSTLRPLNQAEQERLRQEFIIDTTYNSNAIEGNTLTLRETALIIQHGMTIAEKPIREHLEVIGFKDAFYYIIELANQNEPLTLQAIKDIHSLVLMNDAQNKGRFRTVPVKILGASHDTAEPYKINELLTALLLDYQTWLQHEHPLQAIARLHLEFESIHPFIDGNGRTGRLIINLELIKHGLLPVNIKFSDRLKYYDSFDDYHNHNKDITSLLNLLISYEIDELQRYIRIIES